MSNAPMIQKLKENRIYQILIRTTVAVLAMFILPFLPVAATSQAQTKCSSLPQQRGGIQLDYRVRENKWHGYKQQALAENQFVPINLAGKSLLAYRNANISVNVTHKCNAKCGFCVDALEKKEKAPSGCSLPPSQNQLPPSRDEHSDQFRTILSDLRKLNATVSITGGEPTLDSRSLLNILKALKDFGIRKKVITTNGSLLLYPAKGVEGKRVIDLIGEYGMDHMNISRAHDDEIVNANIMQMKPFLSNESLKEIVRISKTYGIRIRLSVALLKDGIHDISGVRRYLKWAQEIGVEDVIFRQLMDFDLNVMEANWVTNFYKNEGRTIKLDDIFPFIDSDHDFILQRQQVGYYYYSEIYKYKGMNVVFGMTDLTLLDHPETSQPIHNGQRILYEMIYQDSGSLEGTWEPGRDVLVPSPSRKDFIKIIHQKP